MWNVNNNMRLCSEREVIKVYLFLAQKNPHLLSQNHQLHIKHMQSVKPQIQLRPPTAPLRSTEPFTEGPHQNKFQKSQFC